MELRAAAAADRPPALPPDPQQQTRSSSVRRPDGTDADGQIDGRTDGRPTDAYKTLPRILYRQCQKSLTIRCKRGKDVLNPSVKPKIGKADMFCATTLLTLHRRLR